LGRVSNFGFGYGKFPLKVSNFSTFFPSDQKNLFRFLGQNVPKVKDGSASYLLRVKSMPGSGQGPTLGQRLDLLFSDLTNHDFGQFDEL